MKQILKGQYRRSLAVVLFMAMLCQCLFGMSSSSLVRAEGETSEPQYGKDNVVGAYMANGFLYIKFQDNISIPKKIHVQQLVGDFVYTGNMLEARTEEDTTKTYLRKDSEEVGLYRDVRLSEDVTAEGFHKYILYTSWDYAPKDGVTPENNDDFPNGDQLTFNSGKYTFTFPVQQNGKTVESEPYDVVSVYNYRVPVHNVNVNDQEDGEQLSFCDAVYPVIFNNEKYGIKFTINGTSASNDPSTWPQILLGDTTTDIYNTFSKAENKKEPEIYVIKNDSDIKSDDDLREYLNIPSKDNGCSLDHGDKLQIVIDNTVVDMYFWDQISKIWYHEVTDKNYINMIPVEGGTYQRGDYRASDRGDVSSFNDKYINMKKLWRNILDPQYISKTSPRYIEGEGSKALAADEYLAMPPNSIIPEYATGPAINLTWYDSIVVDPENENFNEDAYKDMWATNDDAQPVHNVELDNFWLGEYEVTMDQFYEFVGACTIGNQWSYDYTYDDKNNDGITIEEANVPEVYYMFDGQCYYLNDVAAYMIAYKKDKKRDNGWGVGSRPVIDITWYEAIEFCNYLSLKEGYDPCYSFTNVYNGEEGSQYGALVTDQMTGYEGQMVLHYRNRKIGNTAEAIKENTNNPNYQQEVDTLEGKFPGDRKTLVPFLRSTPNSSMQKLKGYSAKGNEVPVQLVKVDCNFKRNGYRLPTEAEFEYAAKGGDVAFPSADNETDKNTESINSGKGYLFSGVKYTYATTEQNKEDVEEDDVGGLEVDNNIVEENTAVPAFSTWLAMVLNTEQEIQDVNKISQKISHYAWQRKNTENPQKDGDTTGNLYKNNMGGNGYSSPVGTKLANCLGFHDLTGSVWETSWDYYNRNYYQDILDSKKEDFPRNPDYYPGNIRRTYDDITGDSKETITVKNPTGPGKAYSAKQISVLTPSAIDAYGYTTDNGNKTPKTDSTVLVDSSMIGEWQYTYSPTQKSYGEGALPASRIAATPVDYSGKFIHTLRGGCFTNPILLLSTVNRYGPSQVYVENCINFTDARIGFRLARTATGSAITINTDENDTEGASKTDIVIKDAKKKHPAFSNDYDNLITKAEKEKNREEVSDWTKEKAREYLQKEENITNYVSIIDIFEDSAHSNSEEYAIIAYVKYDGSDENVLEKSFYLSKEGTTPIIYSKLNWSDVPNKKDSGDDNPDPDNPGSDNPVSPIYPIIIIQPSESTSESTSGTNTNSGWSETEEEIYNRYFEMKQENILKWYEMDFFRKFLQSIRKRLKIRRVR